MHKASTRMERRPARAGWVVKVRTHYYTGHGRSDLERWTPFLKFAKRYRRQAWANKIAEQLETAIRGGRGRIEAAFLSPDGEHLAIRSEVRRFLGLRIQTAGAVYSIIEQSFIGRVSVGKSTSSGWTRV